MSEIVKTMNTSEALEWKRQLSSAANKLRQILAEGYEREAWRALGYGSWNECLVRLGEEFGFQRRHMWQLHHANENEKIVHHGAQVGEIPERHLRPLSRLDSDDDKREAWRIANETAPGGKLTGKHVEKTVADLYLEEHWDDSNLEYDPSSYDARCKYCWETHSNWRLSEIHANPMCWECLNCNHFTADEHMQIEFNLPPEAPASPKVQQARRKDTDYITLTEWNNGQRWHGEPAKTSMNRVNENIEWAAWSWNPVTGCLHNCPYCYARDIANRFYAQKFEPAYIPERLSQPANTKLIDPRWDGDTGHRNVFTCSMADLFGKWVPVEWIESVIQVARDNPQWTFLYLTKFPVRMAEFSYPSNVWLGTSVDRQHAVHRAETAFTKIKASGFEGVCWLSCEPMMERLTFGSLSMFDWVVMGGASKSTQTPEYLPPFDDIVHLYQQARDAECMIYMKTNLIPDMHDEQRLREYPGG